jgi:hypothetical protein
LKNYKNTDKNSEELQPKIIIDIKEKKKNELIERYKNYEIKNGIDFTKLKHKLKNNKINNNVTE